MEIKRNHYLQALINRMHNHLIKVVTGVRRSGKSYLIFHIFEIIFWSKEFQNLTLSVLSWIRENTDNTGIRM